MHHGHAYYHIYNHANGDDLLFAIDDNYHYFLLLLKRFFTPSICLYAYCLLPNHFHLLISFDHDFEKNCFHQLSKLFNSYTRSFNLFNNRKGSLFRKNFKRRRLMTLDEIKTTMLYIHRNPMHHGFTGQYETWEYSSYNNIVNPEKSEGTLPILYNVFSLFGGREEFIKAHRNYMQ
jgi:putative transposase